MQRSHWRTHRVAMEDVPELTAEEPAVGETEMILALPPKYREVLCLYYCEGYSTKEIARILRRSENTVRSQLARGRARLKLDLEGNYEKRSGQL